MFYFNRTGRKISNRLKKPEIKDKSKPNLGSDHDLSNRFLGNFIDNLLINSLSGKFSTHIWEIDFTK